MAEEIPNIDELEIDVTGLDFSDLEEKYAVTLDEGLSTAIVVDGAPIAPESKVEVLTKVLKKLFSSVGKIKEDGFYIPIENGKTRGFVFIDYEEPESAIQAVRQLNNKKLDVKHKLTVNKLSDIEKYVLNEDLTEEFVEPKIEPYTEKGNLKAWLQDPNGRDQYSLYRGEELSVYFNNKVPEAELVTRKEHWTTLFSEWSPLGTYLVTIHPQGIQSWAGKDFDVRQRFFHPDVKRFAFSPKENYVVTFSPTPLPNQAPFTEADEGKNLIIFDLRTGEKLRSFAIPASSIKERKLTWPPFKWSHDDRYFARITPGQLSIYESATMSLVDKKSLKIDDIVDFEWAPAPVHLKGPRKPEGSYLLCYWTPETANQTTRMCVLDAQSKEVIRSVNLFNVSDCKIYWQSAAKYLCVKVVRFTKSKKSTYTNLELLRLEEKDIPLEVIEVKDTVNLFAWETNGDRFATISRSDVVMPGVNPSSIKNTVTFYAPEVSRAAKSGRAVAGLNKWKAFKTIPEKMSNILSWSPKGRFLVVGALGSPSGCEIELYDFDFEGLPGEKKDASVNVDSNVKLIHTMEAYGLTDVAWDPSGRYLSMWSSSWRHNIENGYKIIDLKGDLIREESLEKFKALQWRPRPPSILSEEDKKEVMKKLRNYSRKFEEDDLMEANSASRAIILLRKKLLAEWNAWREAVTARLAAEGFVPYYPIDDDEENTLVIEEIKEVVLEETEEVVE